MIVAKTIDQAWFKMLERVMNCGQDFPSRIGNIRELCCETYCVEDIRYNWPSVRKGAKLPYGIAEIIWFMIGRNDIDMLKYYAPTYEKYCNKDDDGTFRALGAYGHRWANLEGFRNECEKYKITYPSQLAAVIDLLSRYKDDRRAVVSCWDSKDLIRAVFREVNDIPCSLTWQFMIRNDCLDLQVNVRSHDLWLGGIYDPFTAMQIQLMLARVLNVKPGKYYHHAGSMHVYHKHFDAARKLLETDPLDHRQPLLLPAIDAETAKTLIYDPPSSVVVRAEEQLRQVGKLVDMNLAFMKQWDAFMVGELVKYHNTLATKGTEGSDGAGKTSTVKARGQGFV